MKRSSGVLMPIFSIPSKYGIGDLGYEAYQFVDLLSKCKQSYWQVLPINPIEKSNSPYYSVSSFAGNPLFISNEKLYQSGYIKKESINTEIEINSSHIDYIKIKQFKKKILQEAYANFIKEHRNKTELNEFAHFNKNIYEYAIFESIKKIELGKPFWEWKEELKLHEQDAIKVFEKEYTEDINFFLFIQYIFFEQWKKLKSYANAKGIKIIGDAPIYSANDSCDVWSNYNNFCLDDNRNATLVAGCPPDYFNEEGQLWGNPLYNYDYLIINKYEYLINKFKHLSTLYDCIRIDHFRGYESYYSIKSDAKNAKNGVWKKGPGFDLFDTIKCIMQNTEFIAEDLGFITNEVIQLLEKINFPGMKVMQFAFCTSDNNETYLPHNYQKNVVAYVGTHDNNTFMGFFDSLSEDEKKITSDYLKLNEYEKYNITALKVLYNSNANLVIALPQDIIGIGEEGRINTPGTVSDKNWSYIFDKEVLYSGMFEYELYKLTVGTRRV